MVCADWIQPGPSEIQDENNLIKWVAQNEAQLRRSLAASQSSNSSSTALDLDHIAFFRFCRHGQLDEAEAMLAAGIVQLDTLDPNNARQSALFGACDRGHAAVVMMLLARGAVVTRTDTNNNTLVCLLLSRELMEPGHMEGTYTLSTHLLIPPSHPTFSSHPLNRP